MKYPSVFHLISTEFQKAKIPCILIGGFAVNYYKVGRQTGDVDFLIRDEDFKKASELLVKAGYKITASEKMFARFGNNQSGLMDIDLMFVDPETLEGIAKEGEQTKIAGHQFTVPSLNHLIALKLHSIKFNPNREFKDLLDIVDLIKMNKLNIKSNMFKSLCLKYGPEAIYEKILRIKI